jgi:hypothetical protein
MSDDSLTNSFTSVDDEDPGYSSVHPRLQQPCFSLQFDNCIGVINGTLIPVKVLVSKVLQYVGRHG